MNMTLAHNYSQPWSSISDTTCLRGPFRKAYPTKLSSIQTNPSVHPTVVSPRKLRQLSTKSSENGLPATSTVNNINTIAPP